MKRILLVLTICALSLVSVAGCSTPKRDVSTPRKALLGHWKNVVPGWNPDLFYSDTEITFDRGGEANSVTYSIAGEDEREFTLEIKYGSASKPTKVSFSDDRNTMTLSPVEVPELLRYEYVDSKQKP